MRIFRNVVSILSGMPMGKRLWKRIFWTWAIWERGSRRLVRLEFDRERGSPPLRITSVMVGSLRMWAISSSKGAGVVS